MTSQNTSDPAANDQTLVAMMAMLAISPFQARGLANALNHYADVAGVPASPVASTPTPSAGATSGLFLPAASALANNVGLISAPASVPAITTPAAPAPVVTAPASPPPVAQPVLTAPPPGFTTPWVVPTGYVYNIPDDTEPGPYYVVTRGRSVGVFAGWEIVSPLVTGVPGAVCRGVSSIADGLARMNTVIDANAAAILP